MALRYILSFAVLSTFINISAQGLVTLYDEEENVVNGTVIFNPSGGSSARDTVKLVTVVVGTTDREVSVRRYEVWPVEGSRNFFCWGICYLPAYSGTNPVWLSPQPETLSEGEYFTGFSAYYESTGMSGTARFRYVWYDENDPEGPDSSWVDIDFGGAVGVAERGDVNAALEIGPNPSAGNDLVLNYAMADLGQSSEILLFNVLGEKVRRQPLSSTHGRITLSGAGLESGVYFANILRNGRMLATRRVVITR